MEAQSPSTGSGPVLGPARAKASPSFGWGGTTRNGSEAAPDGSASHELRYSKAYGSSRVLQPSAAFKASLAAVFPAIVAVILFTLCRDTLRKRPQVGLLRRRLVEANGADDAVPQEILDMCLDMEDVWGRQPVWTAPPEVSADEDLGARGEIARIEMALKTAGPEPTALLQPFDKSHPNIQAGLTDALLASSAAETEVVLPRNDRGFYGSLWTAEASTAREGQPHHVQHVENQEVQPYEGQKELPLLKHKTDIARASGPVVGVLPSQPYSRRLVESASSTRPRPLFWRSFSAAGRALAPSSHDFASMSVSTSSPGVISSSLAPLPLLRAIRKSKRGELPLSSQASPSVAISPDNPATVSTSPAPHASAVPQAPSGVNQAGLLLPVSEVEFYDWSDLPVGSPVVQLGTAFQRNQANPLQASNAARTKAKGALTGKRVYGEVAWAEASAEVRRTNKEEQQQSKQHDLKSERFMQQQGLSDIGGETASVPGSVFGSVSQPTSFLEEKRHALTSVLLHQSRLRGASEFPSSVRHSDLQGSSSAAPSIASISQDAAGSDSGSSLADSTGKGLPQTFPPAVAFESEEETKRIAPLLRTIYFLLAKTQLNHGEKSILISASEQLTKKAANSMTREVRRGSPRALHILGRRFLVLEALHSVCERLGSAMAANSWWHVLAQRIPTRFSPDEPQSNFEAGSLRDSMVVRLNTAVEKYILRQHVPPEEVAALKHFLFHDPSSPSCFKSRAWKGIAR